MTATQPTREQLLQFLETMLKIRRFEEAVHALSQQGLLGGAAHLSVGQEAIAVGACSAIELNDYITSTHRGHGHCIAKAADKLAEEGIDVEIIDLRTLVPLDIETVVESVRKTSKVMIVEEDCKTGGVGAELVSLIIEHAFDYLDAPPVRVAGLDAPMPYAPLLEKASVPSADSIRVEAIKLAKGF